MAVFFLAVAGLMFVVSGNYLSRSDRFNKRAAELVMWLSVFAAVAFARASQGAWLVK